jgi:Caspase domain
MIDFGRYSLCLLALIASTLLINVRASATGLDEKIVNPNPDRTWNDVAGSVFAGGRSIAVVIGISRYIGERNGGYPDLGIADQDPIKMVSFLKDDLGFDVIYVLTEEKVTKDRLDTLLIDDVRLELGPHDRFLFYWSGHGDQLESGGVNHGFLPLISSKRNTFSSMISMDDIQRWDSFLPARQALFVLDSCLSGLAGTVPKAPHRLEQLSQPAHDLITAGTGGETVPSGERWNGSLFTDSLIKGGQGGAFGPNGVISLWSLYDYVQDRVDNERIAVHWNRSLTPQLSFLRADPGGFFFTPRLRQTLDSGNIDRRVSSIDTGVSSKSAASTSPGLCEQNFQLMIADGDIEQNADRAAYVAWCTQAYSAVEVARDNTRLATIEWTREKCSSQFEVSARQGDLGTAPDKSGYVDWCLKNANMAANTEDFASSKSGQGRSLDDCKAEFASMNAMGDLGPNANEIGYINWCVLQ